MTRAPLSRLAAFGVALAIVRSGAPGRMAAAEPTPFPVKLVDVTAASGVDFTHGNSPTTHKHLIETMGGGVALLDYDNDGWLDLIVTRYVDWSFANDVYCGERRPGYREYCHPSTFPTTANILYRNNHDGTFTDVSQATGIGSVKGRAIDVAVGDYDDDGRPDVYVANDTLPGFLFHSERGKSFTERGVGTGVAVNGDGRPLAGMGVDFGDYDNDGRDDLFVTALSNETCPLYHNDGGGAFSFVTTKSGVGEATAAYAGWGTRWVDLDNDGWKDLFVAQGHVLDTIELTSDHLKYLRPPLVLRNLHGAVHACHRTGRGRPVAALGGPRHGVRRSGQRRRRGHRGRHLRRAPAHPEERRRQPESLAAAADRGHPLEPRRPRRAHRGGSASRGSPSGLS